MDILNRIREEFSFVRGNLLVLIVTYSLFNAAFVMAFPYETPYIRELGASPTIIGLMGSIGALILVLVRIPGSYIADEYGRKQIIVTMTFGIGLSYFFYAFAPDWRYILLGIILVNMCLIYQPALQAITADSIPVEKRGVGYSLVNVIPSIPNIFAPAIAGYIISRYDIVPGMRLIYIIIIIFSFIAAIIRLLYLKETLESPKRLTFREFKEKYKESLTAIINAWKDVSREIKILTVVMMITSMEDPIFIQFASLYVLDVVKIDESLWGIVLTTLFLTNILFGIPAGKIVDKFGRIKPLLTSFILNIPGTLAFIYSRSMYTLMVALIIFGISGSLMGTSFAALSTDLVPRELRGRIMGVMGTLNIIATIPAYVIGGILYEIGPSLPFYLLILETIIVLIIIILFIREPKVRFE